MSRPFVTGDKTNVCDGFLLPRDLDGDRGVAAIVVLACGIHKPGRRDRRLLTPARMDVSERMQQRPRLVKTIKGQVFTEADPPGARLKTVQNAVWWAMG